MILVVILVLSNSQINQYISKHIFQDGKIFSYNIVLTQHKRQIYVFNFSAGMAYMISASLYGMVIHVTCVFQY